MKLYEHQKKIIHEDPERAGLFLGTGSGKTLIALLLARGRTLVICPKTQKEDRNWERENKKNKLGVDLTVMSKETFRRDAQVLDRFDTLIVDESHTALGVTPNTRRRNCVTIPKASQIYEALEEYIKRTKPTRFYLVTATVIRSPMTVWAAGRLLGKKWNFYDWRDTFYVKLPMPGREVFVVQKASAIKDHLAKVVRSIGYTGRLEDYFDVPEQTFKTEYVELTAEQKEALKTIAIDYPEPIVRVGKIHEIENGVLNGDEFSATKTFSNQKIEKLLDYALEFPKMIVFARYTAQIQQISASMKREGYKVILLTGATKNRGEAIFEAQNSEKCIFIAQSSISAGWELPSFPVMVFASRTYSFVDHDQAHGRILRANALKKNLYIYLVTKGGTDEAVHKALLEKQDFNDRIYSEKI